MVNSDRLDWVKTPSCDSGTCVELAQTTRHVFLRNSAEPDVQVRFTHEEWSEFLQGLDRQPQA